MKYIKSMAQQKLSFLLALYIGLFMNGAVFFRRFDGYAQDFTVWKGIAAVVELVAAVLATFCLLRVLSLFGRRLWRVLASFVVLCSAGASYYMLKAGTPEKVDLDPIGTGPFQLLQYQKDSRILYKAFPGYWGTKPKIDRLVFSITPDASVRYAKLQKNECQVMPYPNPADIARMKQDKNINLLEQAGLNVGYLSFNTEKKPFDDVKVRQALTYAVNKEAIIKAVYQGAGVAAKNLIPPTMWGYNNDVKDYSYDPEKAKALLKEAGQDKGFTVELWAMPVQRPYNPNARRMAEMVQADWAKIGVQAKIVTYEWGEYLKRAKAGEHQAVMMGWTGDNGDPDNFFATLFSCAAAKDGSNYSRWCYKPFEDLIQPARATDDHNKRIELYKQAQVVMHDQAPALIVAHSTVYEPVRKEVKGYVVDPLGKHHFENVSVE